MSNDSGGVSRDDGSCFDIVRHDRPGTDDAFFFDEDFGSDERISTNPGAVFYRDFRFDQGHRVIAKIVRAGTQMSPL